MHGESFVLLFQHKSGVRSPDNIVYIGNGDKTVFVRGIEEVEMASALAEQQHNGLAKEL